MVKLQFAPGHNNADDLEDFAVQPEIIKHLGFDPEYTANGIAKRIGGGQVHIRWSYMERSEFSDLLLQLGVSMDNPSTEGTFIVPDWHWIPRVMNGQITIDEPNEGQGFFTNIVAKITGLAYA